MKIENPLSSQVSTGAAAQTGGVAPSQGGVGTRNRYDGYSDRVQLSNLSGALRDLSAEDPGRAAEVQKVASAVDSGAYKIDPVQLGQKIIGDSMEIA